MSNNLPLFPGFLLALLLSACAHPPGKPLHVQALEALPALAAEFETTVIESGIHDDGQPHRYQWRFWRAADRVETRNMQDNTGEIWTKSADGTIAYQRVFHDYRQAIDYVPGDLKAIGIKPDWPAIAMLLNQAMIAPLRADGHEDFQGRSAVHYQSIDPDNPLEIIWLEHDQLPVLIKRQEHGHIVITRLTAIYPLARSPWPYQRSGDYRYTDFSDIGDKENDPFIKSILPKIKGGHHHDH